MLTAYHICYLTSLCFVEKQQDEASINLGRLTASTGHHERSRITWIMWADWVPLSRVSLVHCRSSNSASGVHGHAREGPVEFWNGDPSPELPNESQSAFEIAATYCYCKNFFALILSVWRYKYKWGASQPISISLDSTPFLTVVVIRK
jgi:hypothetical protein